jgi:hypothetical protein
MKLLKMAAATALVACFCGTALAEEANPVEMAQRAGFVGCDELILGTFDGAMKSSERRFSIDYFEETVKNNIDIVVTFGSTGDTVFKLAHFTKSGGYCYSSVRTLLSETANCGALLSKDKYFKYSNDSAGALWSKNQGGVDKLFIQSGNACNQIYIRSEKAVATR